MYGEEHLEDRLQALGRLSGIREDCPEFPASAFVAETWGEGDVSI